MLLAISAGIDFSHIEKNGESSPSCPACTFHLAGVADAITVSMILPDLALNGMVEDSDSTENDFLKITRLAARSPPFASL
jgi:hypothetical protein